MTRRRLIAGNWKMNGLRNDALSYASTLSRRLSQQLGQLSPLRDILICPPASLLWPLGDLLADSPLWLTRLWLGGQDCHSQTHGAYTGEISAPMLYDAGCRFVIIGHSERRRANGETDRLIACKIAAAQAAGLCPIICVGSDEEHFHRSKQAVARQLAGAFSQGNTSDLPEGIMPEKASPDKASPSKNLSRDDPGGIVIAYEPVWAIGSGRTPELSEIAEMCDYIRQQLADHVVDSHAVRLLYGGSVSARNTADILSVTDGLLVGGASLSPDEFWAIATS